MKFDEVSLINDREVFVFRFSYGSQSRNAWEIHSMDIHEGVIEYMSSSIVPITSHQKY